MSESLLLQIKKFAKIRYFNFLTHLSPTLNSKITYKKTTGHPLHLDPPVTLNEKLMWLKLYRYNSSDLVCRCCDKVLVRDYVKEKGCGEYLTEIYGVYDRPEDIDWDSLPD